MFILNTPQLKQPIEHAQLKQTMGNTHTQLKQPLENDNIISSPQSINKRRMHSIMHFSVPSADVSNELRVKLGAVEVVEARLLFRRLDLLDVWTWRGGRDKRPTQTTTVEMMHP